MEPTVAEVVDSSHGRQELPGIVPAEEIQKTLSAILQSTPFRSSKQFQVLLQYIVDETLSGHNEMLKERIIGANIFNRRPDYDTNSDPVVRARVGEVRKRLALFYQAAREESVQISIPTGSFRAVFEWIDKNPARIQMASPRSEPAQPLVEPIPPLVPHDAIAHDQRRFSARFRHRSLLILVAASVVILIWGVQRYFPSSEMRSFNQFWLPILGSHRTTLIYVGGNAVYQLSSSYIDTYFKQHPRSQSEEMGLETYIPIPSGAKIDAQDLFPAKDTFVTIGDVAAITSFESLLMHRNKQFDIRYGGDLTFGDLRQSPTILIGAHNNSWTLTMTGDLRYIFDGRNAIVDRSNPQKRWLATASFSEDYAIVSRILNSKTGIIVISAAGIGYAGTQAAAEFVTNPQAISVLVKTLPKDWEKKNLQIVLHTIVTNQLPSTPDVVATYCW